MEIKSLLPLKEPEFGPMIQAANDAAVAAEFIQLWRNVIHVGQGKTGAECEETGGQTIKMPRTTTTTTTTATAVCRDLQSPKRGGCSGFPGLSHANSPSDVEPSQDIIWDSNSPTQGNSGSGIRNTRAVEISDIVNRIAPKETTVTPSESSLLQWISDSPVHCTPDVPESRTKRRISRRSVDELLKLARQFDENMQKDNQISENLNHQDCGNPLEIKPSETPSGGNTKELKSSSCSDQVETELQALFDSSTQTISGPISQGSSLSVTGTTAGDKPAAEQTGSGSVSTKRCEDFQDSWESDDVLDDFFVLEMSPNKDTTDTLQTEKTSSMSVCQNIANTHPAHPPTGLRSEPVCLKPKSTTRSTFMLESNPRCRLGTEDGEVKPKDQGSSTTQPDCHRDSDDSLWDDGVEDALLYQVCDTMEKSTNSQPREKEPGTDRQRNATAPVPIHAVQSTNINTKRRSSCSFVRSNSVPETSSDNVNYQGWNVTMRGANNQSETRISQSLPGSGRSLGTFSQFSKSPRGLEPSTVTRTTSKSEFHHAAFKRNVTDTADTSNKVFVTSQMMGKCSAVEIERKKQEALARRRRRILERTKSASELRPESKAAFDRL